MDSDWVTISYELDLPRLVPSQHARINRSGSLGSGLLELFDFPRLDKRPEEGKAYREANATIGGVTHLDPVDIHTFEMDFAHKYPRCPCMAIVLF